MHKRCNFRGWFEGHLNASTHPQLIACFPSFKYDYSITFSAGYKLEVSHRQTANVKFRTWMVQAWKVLITSILMFDTQWNFFSFENITCMNFKVMILDKLFKCMKFDSAPRGMKTHFLYTKTENYND